jgi:predicted ArsR family transcriptional regulator
MRDEFADDVSGVGALAEPARRALYLYVASRADPVSREQAADACDVPVHSAKFHLDRLVDVGLLTVDFRRLSGRTGPGAGRPSKLYRRSDRHVSVSLPDRRYDLAGSVLAAAVERSLADGVPLAEAIAETARTLGLRCAEESGRTVVGADEAISEPTPEAEMSVASDVLATLGYEPRTSDADLVLANCPFDALAREHTDVVCGLNVALVDGVLAGLGCRRLEAVLDPAPDLCCVRARPRG